VDSTVGLKAFYVDPYSGEPLVPVGDRLVGTTVSYAVINDIPRFVSDAGITENWSFQWTRWRTLHLGAASLAAPCITEKLGFFLTDSGISPMRILDAGCGSGRNLTAFMNTQHSVWGIDMSRAVDVARQNAGSPNIEIAQADLNFLPFRESFFDVVFSDGVLIHVPDIKAAVTSLVRTLKPEGLLLLAMAKDIPTEQHDMIRREKVINLYRLVTTRISNQRLITWIVDLLAGLYNYRHVPGLRRLVWYLCPELHDDEDWRKCYIHDYLTAKIRRRQRVEAILNILEGLRMKDVSVLPSHEIRVISRKPSDERAGNPGGP
jgi:2-polyprenyl-3-methyl-5-hydroxy-6-metoxy-1,4-benzoquinol methylase